MLKSYLDQNDKFLLCSTQNTSFSSLTLFGMNLTEVKIPFLLVYSFFLTHFLNSHSKPPNPPFQLSQFFFPFFFSSLPSWLSSLKLSPTPLTMACNSLSLSKTSSKRSQNIPTICHMLVALRKYIF